MSGSTSTTSSHRKRRILHLAECLGGGVETAIGSYVRSTPELQHAIYGSSRDGSRSGIIESLNIEPTIAPSRRAFANGVRHVIRTVQPDVVHVHSSWAGFIVRPQLRLRTSGPRIVFSPHTFAFERTNIRPTSRFLHKGVERALSHRTHVLAAASPYEQHVASTVPYARIVYIPHAFEVPPTLQCIDALPCRAGKLKIATMGRITPAKDPDFFLRVVREATSRGLHAHWTWIGGGDRRDEALLRQAGIEVTGWLPWDSALRLLMRNHLYCHTAQWEVGIPFAILEADALGLRVVARQIPQLLGAGLTFTGETPADVAAAVQLAVEDRASNNAVPPLRTGHTREDQAAALFEAYFG